MRITPIIASTFKSDGGSMFGLVPKQIWSRLIPADEDNRIPQNSNCLFVELNDGRKGLLDTGCGLPERYSPKERELHGLGEDWPLQNALSALGTGFEEIDFVVFTHLHWDHAGGGGIPGAVGALQPTFPNAVHYVHEQEWSDALSRNPLLYKSYPPETIATFTVLDKNHLVRVTGEREEILPGIEMIRSGGHTRGHCFIFIHDPGLELNHPDANEFGLFRRLVFAGDLCPTRHHLRLVFQTAYDTQPLETRAWKQDWLPRHAEDHIPIFFDHDPDISAATIRPDTKKEYVTDRELAAGN